MSGNDGRLSWPTALITAFASIDSSLPSAIHERGSSSAASGSDQRRRQHLGAEPDVVAQAEVVGAATEVVEQHVLRREVERPVVALREGVAVDVVRVVDAATRIGVLEPGAADVVVLLEDDEVDAGLLQPVGGEQARHARADDDDAELGVGRDVGLVPGRAAAVFAEQRELLFEQRHVLRHVGAADDELHDPRQLVVRRRRRRATTVVAESRERRERERARLACCSSFSPPWGSAMSIGSGRSSSRSNERSPVTYASAGEQRRELGLLRGRARSRHRTRRSVRYHSHRQS